MNPFTGKSYQGQQEIKRASHRGEYLIPITSELDERLKAARIAKAVALRTRRNNRRLREKANGGWR